MEHNGSNCGVENEADSMNKAKVHGEKMGGVCISSD